MSILFLSDLHLEDMRPETTEWLMAFLEGPARSAEALYILGDLFEYWIGDDAPPKSAQRIAAATSELAAKGLPIAFLHGNRDFLLGEDFARAAGFTLLPETVVVDLHGTPTLLLHGDTLCTDDVDYQAFRARSRDAAWQAGILAMSVEQRVEMARNMRDASREHKGSVAMAIMDTNEEAVQQAFLEHGVEQMIHGHTHRPFVHRHELPGGKTGTRIVLADWYQQGSYLEVNAQGAASRSL